MDCSKWRAMLVMMMFAYVSALPLEQQEKSLEFPNTAFIPGDLTEQLNVDSFFSLWLFFLDDDVFTSEKDFTILAPTNVAAMKPSPNMADKERVRQLLLNHIVLGQAVQSSQLRKSLTLTTLGGSRLHFQPAKDGVTVNGVKILQKEVHVPHGVILVIDDFLFMDQYNGKVQDKTQGPVGDQVQVKDSLLDQFSSIPMITSSDNDFPMIELGTHNLLDGEGHVRHEMVKPEKIGSALANRQKSELNVTKPFYEELVEVLSFLRSGTSDFLFYLEQVNISVQFQADEEYTAFIPMDDSFAQWYPIDWGFNPFNVDQFVDETIKNHFVIGRHRQNSLTEGTVLTTLGGKKLKFSNSGKLMVNGVEVFKGDTPVSRGNIQFIGDLLFVDSETVSELNKKHRDVESAPLVANPWYWSQFLSHIYRELNSREPQQFSFILNYLNRSQPHLRDDLPSYDDDYRTITYTFFVPKDSAFLNLIPQDSADPFVIDDQFRDDIIRNHFVRQRIYDRDLVDGKVLTMANNKTATITRTANVTKINDAVIEESDIFIYNLGNIFIIDDVLAASPQRLRQVLRKHAGEIPSIGRTTSSVQVDDEETATVVIDLIAELLAAEDYTEDSITTSNPLDWP